LVGRLAEMYVQGVSTRKVKAVTEALCGHSFSASSISAINKRLRAFAEQRLEDAYPYLILDAAISGSARAALLSARRC
jgi:putative transposase